MLALFFVDGTKTILDCRDKENVEKKYNYIMKLLGEHGSFNPNFYWWCIIRPSIAHGCAVWIPSSNASISSLESWQYKVAKLILSTNMNIPKSDLFLVLGSEPIKDYLDRQRVSYFARIKNLPITRLCKLVLMEVEHSNTSSGWKYLDHLKFVFNNIGLDHLMSNEININTFKRFCGSFVWKKRIRLR